MAVLIFPISRHHHMRASAGAEVVAGLKNASIGTSLSESSLSRLARPSEASLRPAKILRRCESEQPTRPAMTGTVISFRSAQRSIGCASDMTAIISTRNSYCQQKIFPPEISMCVNELVKCDMAKSRKPAPREIFLGDWLEFFDLGPSEAARIARCSQGYISNISRGARDNINTLYLLALSEEMGITVNDLFRRPPSKNHLAQLQGYSPQAQTSILGRKQRKG